MLSSLRGSLNNALNDLAGLSGSATRNLLEPYKLLVDLRSAAQLASGLCPKVHRRESLEVSVVKFVGDSASFRVCRRSDEVVGEVDALDGCRAAFANDFRHSVVALAELRWAFSGEFAQAVTAQRYLPGTSSDALHRRW